MEILDSEKTLYGLLRKIFNSDITIVSAFASGTEELVREILGNNNKLRLVVGTINCFTTPKFISFCKEKADEGLMEFYCDFRYSSSTHWKLYLVSKKEVIIGSANFTHIGLGMHRDTCLRLRSTEVYNSYMEKIAELIGKDGVLGWDNEIFNDTMKLYESRYTKPKTPPPNVEPFKAWYRNNKKETIKIFIWEYDLTDEDEESKNWLVAQNEELQRPTEYSVLNKKEIKNYSKNDVVLCVRNDGAHAKFYKFDEIKERKGLFYVFHFQDSIFDPPFRIDNKLRSAIRLLVDKWIEEEIAILDKSHLKEIFKKIRDK